MKVKVVTFSQHARYPAKHDGFHTQYREKDQDKSNRIPNVDHVAQEAKREKQESQGDGPEPARPAANELRAQRKVAHTVLIKVRELQAKDVGASPVERIVGDALPVRVLIMDRAVLGA